MKLRMLLCALIVALFTVQTIPVSALDEGMWTFNNVPKADIKQKYGFDVTDEWLRKVQLASVRFPGGSGSFVSPNGLVLTNYHIVEDFVGEMKKGRTLWLHAIDVHGRLRSYPLPLEKFADANAGPPTDPKAFAEQKRMQEQARAEATGAIGAAKPTAPK